MIAYAVINSNLQCYIISGLGVAPYGGGALARRERYGVKTRGSAAEEDVRFAGLCSFVSV